MSGSLRHLVASYSELRAFPQRFLEADEDARTSLLLLLLDAFECFSKSSSNPNVSSSIDTHSDYKSICMVQLMMALLISATIFIVGVWITKLKYTNNSFSAMEEHEGKIIIEISEMVLDRRLDLELRKELYRRRKDKAYDGGDL